MKKFNNYILVGSVAAVGLASGYLLRKLVETKYKIDGSLMVVNTPKEPSLYLNLGTDVDELRKKKKCVFSIKNI